MPKNGSDWTCPLPVLHPDHRRSVRDRFLPYAQYPVIDLLDNGNLHHRFDKFRDGEKCEIEKTIVEMHGDNQGGFQFGDYLPRLGRVECEDSAYRDETHIEVLEFIHDSLFRTVADMAQVTEFKAIQFDSEYQDSAGFPSQPVVVVSFECLDSGLTDCVIHDLGDFLEAGSDQAGSGGIVMIMGDQEDVALVWGNAKAD